MTQISTATLPELEPYLILSTFTKGTPDARSVNFGPSGGEHCPSTCQFNVTGNPDWTPADGWCYAMRLEAARPGLLRRLHLIARMSVAKICTRALAELETLRAAGQRIVHLRFASAGSIRPFSTLTPKDKSALRKLCTYLRINHIVSWLPIADPEEATLYRRLLRGLTTVRLSISNPEDWLTHEHPCTFVAGRTGQTWLQKLAAARQAAKDRYAATGRRCIVCPEIAAQWAFRWGKKPERAKARCGGRGVGCDACTNPLIDIVFPKT